MALWLVRAGKYGEHEPRFFEDNRIYLTWGGLEATNLSSAATYDDIKALMLRHFPRNRFGALATGAAKSGRSPWACSRAITWSCRGNPTGLLP